MHRRLFCSIAATIAAVTASAAVCPAGFPKPLSYDRGVNAIRIAVAVGDLNGDGRPDLVSLHRYDVPGRVGSILLNRGREVFEPFPLNVPAADFSTVLLADVNADGRNDIVLGGLTSLTVLPGRGDGTFGNPLSVDIRNVTAMVSGDFDEDGKLDLAVTQSNPAALTILLGDGEGNFRRGASYALASPGVAIIASDFDGDRHIDLIAADGTATTPFFGKGDGTFTAGAVVASLPSTALTAADLDLDGRPELVAANLGIFVYVYHITAARTFQLVALNNVARPVGSIALTDMDGDGRLDIVTIGGGDIAILHNTAPGIYASPATWAGGNANTGAIIDFDGDGRPDVVVADAQSPQISMLRNTGGQLDAIQVLAWTNGEGSFVLATADMTHDDIPDLIAANTRSGDVSIRAGGAGGFADPVALTLPATLPSGISPVSSIKTGGDFDGDGNLDAAVLSADGMSVFILYGGNGKFERTVTVPFASALCCIEVADMNGDGRADLVYAQQQGGLGVLLSSGALFAPALTFGTPGGVTAMATGDLNRDNSIDVVVAVNGGSAIHTFNGLGDGNLAFVSDDATDGVDALAVIPYGTNGRIVAVGKSLEIFETDGGLTVPGGKTYTLPGGGSNVLAADLDGDGVVDIAVGGSDPVRGQWFVTTFTGMGDGSFIQNAPIQTETAPTSLSAADFERTGAPELALSAGGKILIARSRCDRPRVVLSVLPFASAGIQPLTFIAEAVGEPDQPVTFTIKEGDKVIASAAADETEIGLARLTTTLPGGSHTLTAVATYSDGTVAISDPLTVAISVSRSRAVRH